MKDMSKIYEDASLRYHVKIQKYPQPISERLAEMPTACRQRDREILGGCPWDLCAN